MMHAVPTYVISDTPEESAWDAFLASRRHAPFLQSWTMGDVYADCGQPPVRLAAMDGGKIVGVCQSVLVPARRGRHLACLYGPVVAEDGALAPLLEALKEAATARGCSFIRLSPFRTPDAAPLPLRTMPAPLHVLAEHLWYLPLRTPDPWTVDNGQWTTRTEEELMAGLRKTTRNLVRRAEKDGVTVEASADPVAALETFIALHDETRKRHKFTPYSNAFFRAQVKRFAPRNEVTVYLALYQGETIAASVHMHAFGEASYHHGSSSSAHAKIPASYLLQWTAIKDALKRGDKVYNFWGIAPVSPDAEGTLRVTDPEHPFAGVTLFKTGFGGSLLDLQHCADVPLKPSYRLTRAFEFFRKWKRGF